MEIEIRARINNLKELKKETKRIECKEYGRKK